MDQLPGRIACKVRAGWRREIGLAIYCIVITLQEATGWIRHRQRGVLCREELAVSARWAVVGGGILTAIGDRRSGLDG